MLLRELLEGLEYEVISGTDDAEVTGICDDSRFAAKGNVFICIEGTVTDGHLYAADAVEKGCNSLIIQKKLPKNVPSFVNIIKTKDTRKALANAACIFYGKPFEKFKLVGVTGTKGKTTTVYMLRYMFEAARVRYGIIGTISNIVNHIVRKTGRTTPESLQLQKTFYEMTTEDTEYVAMEVSSQGLMMNRVYGTRFDIGIFTNISRAHIGPKEHSDFEDYLMNKIKLFSMCNIGLVNIDDPCAEKVIQGAKCKVYTFGVEKKADFYGDNIVKYYDKVEFDFHTPTYTKRLRVNMPGRFNVYNALAAAATAYLWGFDPSCIAKGLEEVTVPGRTEKLDLPLDCTVMIDYAHSPDSLLKLLSELKELVPGRLISLFGCGGDRDRAMRPMMGEISGKYADFTIITSDNPRTERPEDIIDDIEEGIKKTNGKYIKITDRTEAIAYAIKNAQPNDLIVLAGKGHEDYVEVNGKKYHYDEREVVRNILNLT
ncbi:MAG: UDP-N-acetylmuramoyl-L-alanyl-D-glutamate--2,6-diaminopimelate ligase [Clostridia bacterium]|jgi:UDP-N-acetylmuramoyl-L-alanyl-D-glutamate--2,6-diaminopimelate ligase|nr:UDP-N-acetylmuramoyl-L-alanyl-D-glutamate--2,6-diaminopimelate ligase [Clostridiaceae bacterium]